MKQFFKTYFTDKEYFFVKHFICLPIFVFIAYLLDVDVIGFIIGWMLSDPFIYYIHCYRKTSV